MNEYELTYEVVGSGGGTVKETVTAASDDGVTVFL